MAGFTGSPPGLSTDPLWAASGDIVYATGDDASSVLAIGNGGYVLTVDCDSTLKWAAPSGISGPDCSTDNAIPTFNGTGGATFQDTTVTISDSNVLTANAGIVVDNFTLDGTELDLSTGSFTLDVAADIEINADGGCVNFKDADLFLAAIVNSSCVGELRIHEADNYVGFKAPALTGNQIWTLPAAVACCADDVLTCNGSGVLSWATAGGGGGASALQVNDSVAFAAGTGSDSKIYYDGTDSHWDLRDTGSGALVIALGACHPSPDGNAVHIWEGTAGSVTARSTAMLILESNSCVTMQFLSPGSGTQQQEIMFGDAACVTMGSIIYDHGDDQMRIGTSGAGRAIFSTNGFLYKRGCASTPAFSYICDPDTGTYSPSGNEIAWSTAGTARMRLDGTELRVGQDLGTPNSKMSTGISVCQDSCSDEIFALKSSSVDHGFTSVTETCTYFTIKKINAAGGGALLSAYSDGAQQPLRLQGNSESDLSDCRNTNAIAGVATNVYKLDGDAVGAVGTNMNIFVVQQDTATQFLVDKEGDVYYNATANGCAWDEYCDVALLTSMRAITMPDNAHFKNQFSSFIGDYACILEQTGVVHLNRDTDSIPFISTKGLNGLIIDSIRQMHGRVVSLETELKALSEGK